MVSPWPQNLDQDSAWGRLGWWVGGGFMVPPWPDCVEANGGSRVKNMVERPVHIETQMRSLWSTPCLSGDARQGLSRQM